MFQIYISDFRRKKGYFSKGEMFFLRKQEASPAVLKF